MSLLARYRIKDVKKLSSLLWSDCIVGATFGGLGLGFHAFFTRILGLPQLLVIWVSAITLLYSIFVFSIAKKKIILILRLRILIYANWFWAIISIGIISLHFSDATVLGKLFLIMQIVVSGGLAWLEGNQVEKLQAENDKI